MPSSYSKRVGVGGTSTPWVRVNQVVNNEVLLRNEVLLALITANTGVRTEDQSRRDLPERYNRGMMRRGRKKLFLPILIVLSGCAFCLLSRGPRGSSS